MICQRCGNCCITMAVVIRIEDKAVLKPEGRQCPHLSFEGSQACCAVHGESWFKGSPCHIYGNSNYDPDFLPKRGKPCPIGKLFQEHGGLSAKRKIPPHASEKELYDCGSWPEG
jgi:hypothetical protein